MVSAHRVLSEEEAREFALEPLLCAGLLVSAGEADGAVAGAVAATADVIRAGLWCVGPAEGMSTVSSAFYMVVPPFRSEDPEVLTFTDAGVVQEPTSSQLAEIGVAYLLKLDLSTMAHSLEARSSTSAWLSRPSRFLPPFGITGSNGRRF